MRRSGLRIRTPEQAHAEQLARDPLRDFFVWWDDVSADDVQMLQRALTKAEVERDLQRFLESNPKMLIQHLGGGHGRWVLPQRRLGAEHVPDFLIADHDSAGRHWTAVELEGPQRPMFTKKGDPSRYLWHGIRQIIDWRVWLELNQNYAARPPDKRGLGLEDISPSLPGLVLIGRRGAEYGKWQAFRRGLARQLNIEIHSYDWLVDRAAARVRANESRRAADA